MVSQLMPVHCFVLFFFNIKQDRRPYARSEEVTASNEYGDGL